MKGDGKEGTIYKIEHYESLTNEEIDLMIRNLEHLKENGNNNKQT
jgi:molecular chaperone DnaK (HSP70)